MIKGSEISCCHSETWCCSLPASKVSGLPTVALSPLRHLLFHRWCILPSPSTSGSSSAAPVPSLGLAPHRAVSTSTSVSVTPCSVLLSDYKMISFHSLSGSHSTLVVNENQWPRERTSGHFRVKLRRPGIPSAASFLYIWCTFSALTTLALCSMDNLALM